MRIYLFLLWVIFNSFFQKDIKKQFITERRSP